MKKLIDRVAFRFGYVPITQVHAAVDAGTQLVQTARIEKMIAEHEAQQAARRHAAVETGQTRVIGKLLEEVAATRPIPVVTR